MMWLVSGPSETNGRADLPQDGPGVLGSLPKTRPQRASARREAARSGGASRKAASAASPNGARPKAATAGEKAPGTRASAAKSRPAKGSRPARASRSTARRLEEPVPRQGFACEEDQAVGEVQPPGGADLVNTAAEIVAEVAKAGVSGGERLLRDIFSRLPR